MVRSSRTEMEVLGNHLLAWIKRVLTVNRPTRGTSIFGAVGMTLFSIRVFHASKILSFLDLECDWLVQHDRHGTPSYLDSAGSNGSVERVYTTTMHITT